MIAVVLALFACAKDPAAPVDAAAPAPAADEHAHHVADPAATPAAVPAGRVFFVAPADGAVVKSPLKVQFGVEGMTVAPAGTLDANTGHHHVILDGVSVPQGEIVPKDDTHIHFGQGQTETEVTLTPGKHTLTMQFADGNHFSYGPAWSSTVTITVE